MKILISADEFWLLPVSIAELCITIQGHKNIPELIPFLFNEVNELKQVVERLKSENEELKSKLANLKIKKNSDN